MWCSSGAEIKSDWASGQVSRAFGHGDPVFWRGEANPVQLAVHLGQDVGSGEGGPSFGHGLHRDGGRIGQDAVGQVAGCATAAGRCDRRVRRPKSPGRFRRSARPAGATDPVISARL